MRKYNLIANELSMIYRCKVKILPYFMIWEGIVTKCHKKYSREIGIQPKTQAYIQSLVLRMTLESLFFDKRRGLEEDALRVEPGVLCENLIRDCTEFIFTPATT
ncbi:hypothetical protein BDAP_001592 [Binucleata daphniae]